MASLFKKKTEVKLELLTDINMLLTVEKELQEEHVMQYKHMQKQKISTIFTIFAWKNENE